MLEEILPFQRDLQIGFQGRPQCWTDESSYGRGGRAYRLRQIRDNNVSQPTTRLRFAEVGSVTPGVNGLPANL